jgi:hypothetical protein
VIGVLSAIVSIHGVLGAQEVWQQLKSDIYNAYSQSRSNYCSQFGGNFPNDNAKVTCEGNIEVVGFPCLNCDKAFDWHDYDSVKRCSADQACQTSGLDLELTGFDGHTNFLGQVPQMYAGTTYNNYGDSQDFQEFTYEKEEDESFTLSVTTGVSLSFSTEVSVNLEVASVKETFGFKLDLSTTVSSQTVKKRSWSAKEHVTLDPHTQTKLSCFLMSNSFRGDYQMQLKATGPVLIVVWNKDGTSYHPYYTYYSSDTSAATIQGWFPNGYQYNARLEGLEGVEVHCEKNTTPLMALNSLNATSMAM